MPMWLATVYAGWILVDSRMLLFLFGAALLITSGTLAIFVRSRAPRSYAFSGAALFFGSMVVLWFIFAVVLGRPPLVIESMFPLP